ncbi:MAG: hypothetical protein UW94_C0013G0025 [Parcubacteria group bacterium GW2011_GWA2_45_14]|nr:MAG: hypothetical protein UW94_C0013G0025 [Parcubacteria group bacterium GW2011_GWA2_45_14]OGY35566.1 MAG: hypothetical protein A3B76_02215 [Candidatus Andersenbacteria bacterium RIFCSPHIGHO2_02_FULL_46_16]
MPAADKPSIKPQIYQSFNITRAVTSLLLTRYEYHTRQQVYDGHYWPTDDVLAQLANQPPSVLTAIASQPATLYPKWPGQRVNIYLLLPDQSVIFIGCICDRNLTNQLYDYALSCCRDQSQPEKIATLTRRGKVYVHRSEWLCAITTLSEKLTSDILTEGLRRYLDIYSTGLINVPINWLNDSNPALAASIHQEIISRANALADPPITSISVNELSRLIQEHDFDESWPPPPEKPSSD